MTVVFCDLVGSTALSGRLDPETLRWVTLRYFAAMRERIETFGGTVEKFIGDAVMAVFGTPVMHEDDAHRAAAAAAGMVEALAILNAELEQTHGVRLEVRIGVHTGPAVTSTEVSTRQTLVSGETVNIAARLEQHAGAGEILIGPLTREAIGPVADTVEVGPLRLKGKQEAVVAHRLLAIGSDSPELRRRFDLPFVGREPELSALGDTLAAGGTVTVLGEPGIGKTRLVRAWLDRADPPPRHGWGRCRPYGEQGSLAPLADAVRALLAGSPVGEPVLEAYLLLDGTPGPSVEATTAALVRVLATAGVPVLDDCQWASDPLLDLLDHLAGQGVPVVRLARFDVLDRRPSWCDGPGTLLLTGLDAGECEIMAATLVEVGAHAVAAPAAVLESTGGNPFYLEQLVAAAAERAGSDPGADLPTGLQSLIGARIDALPDTERTTLDLAAVLGREFTAGHLTELAGTGPVGAELTRLCDRRLVEPPGRASADVFRFSNGLIHEATYQVMAKRVRAERHERAADVLAERRRLHRDRCRAPGAGVPVPQRARRDRPGNRRAARPGRGPVRGRRGAGADPLRPGLGR
nr:hypothetical protein GCM10020092_035470 [Actinoplanes digitatis]